MIQPFKIINDDGTINQEEYNRCIEFLNQYVSGSVPVSGRLVWDNPFEINEDNERSSLEILLDEIYNQEASSVDNELITNRLLTANCFSQFKRFFQGFVRGFTRTIYANTATLRQTKRHKDGPGYYYNPFSENQEEIIYKTNHLPYLNDSYRTVMSWDRKIDTKSWIVYTEEKYPYLFYNAIPDKLILSQSNPVTYLRDIAQGSYYSIFYMTNQKYKQTNVLFYLSECSDRLLRSGFTNYYEDRLNRSLVFTVYSDHTGGYNDGKQCLGFPLNQIQNILDTKLICNETQLDPSVNTHGSFYNINYFDKFNTTAITDRFNL